MATSEGARDGLVRALEADLVGPFHPEDFEGARDEVLELPPSRWYLTGFLAPERDRETIDATADDELGAGPDEDDDDASPQEPEPKQRKRYPASMGMSVLLPAAADRGDAIRATVRFAEYVPEAREVPGRSRPRTVWRRSARGPFTVDVPLDAKALERGVDVPDAPGVSLKGKLEKAEAPGLPERTRALSLFVVNERSIEDANQRDAAYMFQVELELDYTRGFVPRPNRRGETGDWDDRVAELQFRDRFEWAVGHGVSVTVGDERPVRRVRTTWLPRSEVRRVVPRPAGTVVTSMEQLAELADGAAARARLEPLVSEYSRWIEDQARVELDGAARRETRDELVRRARRACARIRSGIQRLASDEQCLTAFRLANRAMADAALRRSPERYSEARRPEWRLFQLAFVLMNLDGLADEAHADREAVDLIFFPTGGGKTEAYLGVIAFTLLLRRLQGRERADRGLGVAVLLRYTLRLLTLDQLSRAATLLCALEMLRRGHPELREDRFAVGLWVGRTATANTLEQVRREILEYKNSTSKTGSSPFPLVSCPWCNTPLGPDSLTLVPSPTKAEAVVAACTNFRCEFAARNDPAGLPVLFVDEQIYKELPAFLVATVDKFAMLPWRGETAKLFGSVASRAGSRFFGHGEKTPKDIAKLPDGLRPPELIVQDELHLISGPLGTMVGLYETAIDYLSTRARDDGRKVRPKIIASTATVRRAGAQIRALFGRADTGLFPPPGVNESDTWFAKLDPASPGRLYVGVAAQGRALKAILLRAYVTLLAAAQKQYAAAPEAADPYMTLAGYFNSLRELGGMRRLVEDEVRTRCLKIEDRRPLDHTGAHPWFAKRSVQNEPVELTSREHTNKIKDAKDRLAKPQADKAHVDVLLASNMISVGVDIDRLGLMVVGGQPKTTSEYIQASSRVGRQYPGLVVTCFNVGKPRDRSHYERFAAYHESFYRFVEATSVTPFSGPALERGLAATLVAMARLSEPELTPSLGAMRIGDHRDAGERAVQDIANRGAAHDDMDSEEAERTLDELRRRGAKLVENWESIMRRARQEAAGTRCYSRFDKDKQGPGLLYMVTDDDKPDPNTEEARFAAPTSMRDVEPSVHLWLVRGKALGSQS
jgi:Helicase conserved C-terminal domain